MNLSMILKLIKLNILSIRDIQIKSLNHHSLNFNNDNRPTVAQFIQKNIYYLTSYYIIYIKVI